MNLWKFIKQPGSIRIAVGSVIVISLLLLAVLGDHILVYSAQHMDTEYIMEPPSLPLFRSWLITEKGYANLRRYDDIPFSSNQEKEDATREREEEEDYEDLSYLSASSEEEDLTSPAAEQEVSPDPRPVHKHYLGTDKDGRDMLALLLAGAKSCLLPGLLACLVALGLGFPAGITGGYYGGRWADFIQFLNSVVLSFPRFVLILVVICALEPNVYLTMIVLGLTITPRVSELMRNRVRTLSRMGFVLAAKESGLPDWKIMVRHLFWFQNRTVFFIQTSLIMSESILVETTLSYLQFGTKPPAVSWGNIIEGSRLAFFSEYYWITFFPAVLIVAAILGFFYLGDGLNARLEYHERN